MLKNKTVRSITRRGYVRAVSSVSAYPSKNDVCGAVLDVTVPRYTVYCNKDFKEKRLQTRMAFSYLLTLIVGVSK